MTLAAGTRLGAYEITGALGAGGMGEVYRATDTNLKRDVAIKILPSALAENADRLARFQREAEVLASLNHANIAQIYGLERSDGTTALIMELVEGPTLADRIAQGPIPPDEALGVATQIADALEAAHVRGIVHRDLKPANIKITPDGTVKVLDFGIAKALETRVGISGPQAPSLTTPAMTQAGILLGTAGYMSPEQARGKEVDQRADIWAFGCVLYEMLTGQPAFGGDDVSATLARVLERDVSLNSLPSRVPPAISHTIGLCLEKDPKKRIADIRDVKLALTGGFEPASSLDELPAKFARPRSVGVGLAAAFLLGAAAALGWRSAPDRSPGTAASGALAVPMIHTVIDLPAGAQIDLGSDRPLHGFDSPAVTVSPDGSRLAYVGTSDHGKMLYVREMAGGEFRALAGTEGAETAFFSPDGKSLGFLTKTQVKRLSLDSGAVAVLADTRAPVRGRWTENGLIYFSEDQGQALARVPADGSRRASQVAEVKGGGFGGFGQAFTDVLPDGRGALLDERKSISRDYSDIILLDTETLKATTLLHNGYGARYVPPGYLLFGRRGNLMAVRFDLERRAVVGQEVLVAKNVGMESLFGIVQAAVSANGLLVFVPGGDLSIGRLAWVDRRGTVDFIQDAPPATYGVVDLSPDGRRIAVEVADVNDYIWIYDTVRQEGRRVSGSESYGQPKWRPPGGHELRLEAYNPQRTLIRNVDGGGPPAELLPSDLIAGGWQAWSWTPDGKSLAFRTLRSPMRTGFVSVDDRIVQMTDLEDVWLNGFSPDGKYFPYTDEHDRYQIWIASYPDAATKRLISDSGIETVWCPCGELFYRDGNRWYSTHVTTGPKLAFDPPRLAFETDFIDTVGISYAVSPDGERLLVVKRAEPAVFSRLQVVTNWARALKQAGQP
jgi:hypothetical protein